MDTANQIRIFLLCVLAGVIGGAFCEPFSLIGKLFKRLQAGLDVAFFVVFSFVCVYFSAKFAFPDYRLYGYCGNFIGLIIYLKTFHRIVAFFEKICYNMLIKPLKRRKKTKESKKKEVKKIRS